MEVIARGRPRRRRDGPARDRHHLGGVGRRRPRCGAPRRGGQRRGLHRRRRGRGARGRRAAGERRGPARPGRGCRARVPASDWCTSAPTTSSPAMRAPPTPRTPRLRRDRPTVARSWPARSPSARRCRIAGSSCEPRGCTASTAPTSSRPCSPWRRPSRRSPVVDDQRGQPTWSRDLARQIVALLDAGAPAGTYHGTSSGETTWFGFTREIYRLIGADPQRVHPTTTDAFPRPAPRPAYSVLGHDRWAAIGLAPIRDWREALAEALPLIRALSR